MSDLLLHPCFEAGAVRRFEQLQQEFAADQMAALGDLLILLSNLKRFGQLGETNRFDQLAQDLETILADVSSLDPADAEGRWAVFGLAVRLRQLQRDLRTLAFSRA